MNQKVQRFMKHCQCVDLKTNLFHGNPGKRQEILFHIEISLVNTNPL